MSGAPGYIWSDGASTINMSGLNQSQATYRLMTLLQTAGWTFRAGSDGTTFSNTPGNGNNPITSAAKLANSNAWFVYAQPAVSSGLGAPGNSQICIKHGTTQALWVTSWVPPNSDGTIQAATVGGTATAVPTWTTAVEIGGGADTNTTGVLSGTGTYTYVAGAMNVAPYNFIFYGFDTNGNVEGGPWSLFFDNLVPGSYDELDTLPVVVYGGATGANMTAGTSNGNIDAVSFQFLVNVLGGGRTIVGFGTSYQAVAQVGLMTQRVVTVGSGSASSIVLPWGVGPSPYGSQFREKHLPAFWGVGGTGAAPGTIALPLGGASGKLWPWDIKGRSSLFTWQSSVWAPGTMGKRLTVNDVVAVGNVWVPHDGATQLAVR